MFNHAEYLLMFSFLLVFTLNILPIRSTGRSARRRGDVTLGGLFPIHEYGSSRETCGPISAFRGIQRLEAMLFAIEQINNDRHLLPGIELGALIFDTCSDDNYALEQSLGFVRNRLTATSCTCANKSMMDSMQNDFVFGVVGASLSSVTVHVANLLRLFQLPQISYASTTPKLSEPSFDYFARTVPSDSNQARAIVDILQYLNFTYVNTIYSHGDYGEGGFREFKRLLKMSSVNDENDDGTSNSTKKHRMQRICIADEQRLRRDATIQDIKSILDGMLQRTTSDVPVRVYVLFLTKEDARKLLQAIKLFNGVHRPVLIASDAWGKESSVVIQGETDDIAVGALTLELVSIHPHNFQRYFNALRPEIIHHEIDEQSDENYEDYHQPSARLISSRNPWFNEFWEHRFACNLTSSPKCAQNQLNETNWDSKLQFIVDATYVFAQALHIYFNCTPSICYNVSFNTINGTRLFQIILERTFSMPDFRQIQFNSERFVPGHYRIYNYRQSLFGPSGSYEYASVGQWKTGPNKTGQLNLVVEAIVWPGQTHRDLSPPIPTSRCSEPCRVGEIRQVQGDSCCWVCLPCNETSIVIEIDEHGRCEACPFGFWPTVNRTRCYKLEETSIDLFSAQAFIPILLSIVGNMLTLFVVILFYKKRHTPIVKASGQELCFIMLAGIDLCYLMTLPILLRPRLITCIIQRVGIGLSFSMMYAALLTKTNRIARIFESTKKQGRLRPKYISPHSQVLICSCLILVQIILSLLWLIYERPSVDMIPYARSIILKCHMSRHSFLLSLVYNAFLVLICTMYAIRTRKVPENFNETKFIGFTCYTTCIIWLAFLPIYFTAHETGRHQIHITTLCITISLSATVALACLFSPKVYIILMHPEKNMRITKHLKVQATSFKFASTVTSPTDELPVNHETIHYDPSNSDTPTKLINNDNQQNVNNNSTTPSMMIINNQFDHEH